MSRVVLAIILAGCTAAFADAQFLAASPSEIILPGNGQIEVTEGNGAHVKFTLTNVVPIGTIPNFVVLAPSSGTTPASLQISFNPSVVAMLQPGAKYELILNFTIPGVTPPTSNTGPLVRLQVPAESPTTIQSVVNSASFQPVLSPGALVSILGSHLTGPTLSTTFDDTASYPPQWPAPV